MSRGDHRRSTACFAAAFLTVAAIGAGAGRAAAHIVSDAEVVALLAMPRGIVTDLVDVPDAEGNARANHPVWNHVEHQSEPLVLLIDACARSDSTLAEAAWKSIDAGFLHQRPSGDYESAEQEARFDQLTRTAWWIAQLCRAEIVVTNSPLVKRFQWRVALMRPKLRRSVDWLVAAGDELLRLHEKRPELLLVDAQAYLLADGIYHEPRFAELGQRALARALPAQTKDGGFVTDARGLWAHARALVALLEIATYFPMPSLDERAGRAAQWLARHLPRALEAERKGIAASASGGGPTDAILALGYQVSRAKDARLLRAVQRARSAVRPRSEQAAR